MTPREVSRRYSKGRDLEVVFKNGYRNSGMWAGKISKVSAVRYGKYIYRSRTEHGSRCVMPRIVEAPAHCRLGLMQQL